MINVNAIINAANLDDLCEALNDAEDALLEINSESGTWDQERLEGLVDMTSLPTFGVEPRDTMEIFSWDDTRIIYQGDDPKWEITGRHDLDD